jgi:hypothetical protein
MECGVDVNGTSITAVSGQTGRLGQIVKWVNAAWLDIQTRHDDWKFMRSSFTVDTTSGDGKYAFGDCTDTVASATISAFRKWCTDTFKIYLTSAGSDTETDLHFIDFDDWYIRYNTGAQANSFPHDFTVDHDMGFLLAPKPDGIYTVRGEYMKSATVMSADVDVPALPAEYRMAIVYRAMMKYGRYNGAPEVFTDGQAEYKRIMVEVARTQRPAIKQPGPLA